LIYKTHHTNDILSISLHYCLCPANVTGIDPVPVDVPVGVPVGVAVGVPVGVGVLVILVILAVAFGVKKVKKTPRGKYHTVHII